MTMPLGEDSVCVCVSRVDGRSGNRCDGVEGADPVTTGGLTGSATGAGVELGDSLSPASEEGASVDDSVSSPS
jgi:hypothetical protein